MRKVILSFFVFFLLSHSLSLESDAAEIAGVTFPEKVKLGETELVLNGTGLRTATFFKIKVYAAALYLEKKSQQAQAIIDSPQKKRLVLQFVRSVEAEKVRGGWDTGFKSNTADISNISSDIATFNSKMADMNEGDKMVFDFYADKVVAQVKSSPAFEVKGEEFRKALIAIWLGKNPPNEPLKAGLLGAP
jgi:hypothetical protein